jgi:Tfp pilus assembly protein PilF
MDTETAEEVLTLRCRGQLASHTHGFNPRVRFSPDGRSLLAICYDEPSGLAEWSIDRDLVSRLRTARRRAVGRHLAVAAEAIGKSETAWQRRAAPGQLELAGRIGLESPREYLIRAEQFDRLSLWRRADDDLEQAAALAPGDDEITAQAAFLCAYRGRFRRAGMWYDRMSGLPSVFFSGEWGYHAISLVLAGDHVRYRRFSEELLRRRQVNEWTDPSGGVIYSTLESVPSVNAGEWVRIARSEYDAASADKDASRRFRAGFALGAALVRAGDPARAEPPFREAMALVPEGPSREQCHAWLAIALLHQGRRDEAKTWFDRADRFVRAHLPGGRPELEHRPPDGLHTWDWWHLIIVWREAQVLLLDGAFPADPFAR